jgi:hypothetical protein
MRPCGGREALVVGLEAVPGRAADGSDGEIAPVPRSRVATVAGFTSAPSYGVRLPSRSSSRLMSSSEIGRR